MSKKTIIISMLLSIGVTAYAQHDGHPTPPRCYSEVLRIVEQSSPRVSALMANAQAEHSRIDAERTIENPAIEGGFYQGAPSSIGKRWDLSVTQSFDMPSVYRHRRQLRNLGSQQVQLQTSIDLIQIFYEAQQYCAHLAYYHQLAILFDEYMASAHKVADIYTLRMDHGDCTAIEYNQAMMDEQQANNELALARLEALRYRAQLATIAGTENFPLPEHFQASSAIDWHNDSNYTMPRYRLMQLQEHISEQEVALSRSERLPQMEVGYASENVVGETYRGVTLQLNVPLWNNRRKIQSAVLQQTAAHSQTEAYLYQIDHECDLLRVHAQILKKRIEALQNSMQQHDNRALIEQALLAGEMTLEDYLRNKNYYLDLQKQLLNLQLQLELTLLELYSYFEEQ